MPELPSPDYTARRMWDSLVFNTFRWTEVQLAVGDPHWKALLTAMHGTTLECRWRLLTAYVTAADAPDLLLRQIRVTHYVHLLVRGWMIW